MKLGFSARLEKQQGSFMGKQLKVGHYDTYFGLVHIKEIAGNVEKLWADHNFIYLYICLSQSSFIYLV